MAVIKLLSVNPTKEQGVISEPTLQPPSLGNQTARGVDNNSITDAVITPHI